MAVSCRGFSMLMVWLSFLWLFFVLCALDQLRSHRGFFKWEYSFTGAVDTRGRQPALRILSWTKQSGSARDNSDWNPFDQDPSFKRCTSLQPWMTCEYTADKALYNQSEAVLFRGRRLGAETLPSYKADGQKWIFYEFEPPYKIWNRLDLTPFENLFNLTSTFTFDSDIPLNLQRNVTIAPNKLYHLKQINMTYHQKKNKLVAWFVSICKTQSQREAYVEELQKYIQVDIYGLCGPLRCGTNNQNLRSACDEKLLSAEGSYKFYLSFENSLCEDYVTEKLWRLMNQDVLQVVMGGVDYSSLLPAESYLDIRDFPSPKALANHLLYLDSNHTAYNYHVRRKRGIKIEIVGVNEPYHCRLCRYLHLHRQDMQVVNDLASFWGIKTRCRHPTKFYKGHRRGVSYRMS